MLEENNLSVIFENLELEQDFLDLVGDIVEEHYRYRDDCLYDEKGVFIYNEALIKFLRGNDITKDLSNDELNFVLEMITNNIIHKIEAKGSAHIRAQEDAYYEENRSRYGGTEGAYGHLLEEYLYDFNYNKSLSDFYFEYLEKNKIK